MSKLSELLDDVMDLDDVEITEDTTARDVEDWDSLSNVRLMVTIERAFGISFTNAEIEGFGRVGDIIDLIQKKTSA
ncbi:acyl carrier protein [Blastopirellula marina]|uniref:acyl carrier protein n=1 Tax=Blastopirellula marina TaxID=124 RepID=UPI0018EC7D06|nr:acyl carrier protein [Blastopirellula marina]